MSDLDLYTNSEIEVSAIVVGGDNPRELFSDDKLAELAESIRVHGLQQPLVVRRAPFAADGLSVKESAAADVYVLVAGERRLRAVKLLGWRTVPCRVSREGMSDREAAIATVVENVEREDLSTYELARACQILSLKYELSGEATGKVVRRTKFYVNNLLRCLRNLDPSIIAAWRDGHDKATSDDLTKLAGVKDKAAQLKYWQMLRDGEDPFAVVEEVEEGEGADGEGDSASAPEAADGAVPPKAVKADTKRALEVAESLAAYRKAGGEGAQLAIETLRYVLGKRKTNPVNVPDRSKELEKAADDILAAGVPLLKAPKVKTPK